MKPQRHPMSTRDLAIAVPMPHGGGLNSSCAMTLRAITTRFAMRGQHVHFLPRHGLDQMQCRAELADTWLHETDAEDCLFLDSDVALLDTKWADLLCILEEPLVCGIYRSRPMCASPWVVDTLPLKPDGSPGSVTEILTAKHPMTAKNPGGKVEVRALPLLHCGFGFVRIRRRAYMRMINWAEDHDAALPERFKEHRLIYRSDLSGREVADLWRPLAWQRQGEERWNRGGDDWAFFERSRAAGLTLKALLDMPLEHQFQSGASYAEECGQVVPADPTPEEEAMAGEFPTI